MDFTASPSFQFGTWRNIFMGVRAEEEGQRILNLRLDTFEDVTTEVAFCTKIRNELTGGTELVFGQLQYNSVDQVQVSEIWTRSLKQRSKKTQECTAVKQMLDNEVYFALISNDQVRLVWANFQTGVLEITTDSIMPYPINFSPDLTRNTILNEEANMIIVGIDNKVAGSAERDYDFGYIIETRDKDRRNPILNKTLSLIPRA